MNFEISEIDALGRIGEIELNRKKMVTPNLFPVVHPYNNLLNPQEIKSFGADCIFTNSYILFQKNSCREEVLKKGLHEYLNFDGLIATDSGAFQQYMYNDGVEINAEEIENFQQDIKSDFPVILDIPVQLDDDYNTAKEKVKITIERAKDNLKRRNNDHCAWFGPIHGAKFSDLVEHSAYEMSKLDFPVYAIGGLVKAFLDYNFKVPINILLTAKRFLVPNRPIHMFGLGLPQYFSLAVACGCDLMDSAAYALYAKEDRYFTLSTGTKDLNELIEFPCHCPICTEYSPNEVKKLEREDRSQLLAKHNLYISFSELKTIRQAIREGNLWELVNQRIQSHPFLVEAKKILKNYTDLFEKSEPVYKKHGRLFSSIYDIERPIVHRYEKRLQERFKLPTDVKYLLIVPEFNQKGINSPELTNIQNIINTNEIIPQKLIQIFVFSDFFGIIPIELSSTFPMGQYESIYINENQDFDIKKPFININKFMNYLMGSIKKIGLLLPSQVSEIKKDPKNSQKWASIHKLEFHLSQSSNLNIYSSSELTNILEYFQNE